MWKRIFIAATVGLTSVTVPMPAMAAVPSPVPAQMAPEQSCDQVIQRAQRAALATGKDNSRVICVSRVVSPTVAPDAATIAEAASCGYNSWGFSRHGSCTTQNTYSINVLALIEGVPTLIGAIPYSVSTRIDTSGFSLQWEHNFTITFGVGWGAIGGLSVNANAECAVSNCTLNAFYFNLGPALSGTSRGGRAVLTTSSLGVDSYWQAGSTWRWWFTDPGAVPPISNSLTITPPTHRCDQAIGILNSVGCVYTQVTPQHQIGRTRWPKYARHIELAINFGVTSLLTRTRDQAQMDANRERACPRSQRPANGWSCDEYPFASTHEGAANPSYQYGRTFQILNWNSGYPPFYCGIGWLSPRQIGDRHGYSVCGIPGEENSQGGVDLGLFYAENRVIHNDRFTVRVV